MFSQEFLRFYKGHEFWGVDTYESYESWPGSRIPDMEVAISRYAPYPNARLSKSSSKEAAAYFLRRRSYDPCSFVYIDGDHSYEGVYLDLIQWWDCLPESCPHGILAGHDFDDTHPGVVRAVVEFAHTKQRNVYLTTRDGPQISWYIYRGDLPADKGYIRNCDGRWE
jgi:hypothetical protein